MNSDIIDSVHDVQSIDDVQCNRSGNFIWTTDGCTTSRSFPFTWPNRGIHINVGDVKDPWCILKEFISPEVIEMIVHSTKVMHGGGGGYQSSSYTRTYCENPIY